MNIKNLFNSIPGIQPKELSPKAKALAERVMKEKSNSELAQEGILAARAKAQIEKPAQKSFEEQLSEKANSIRKAAEDQLSHKVALQNLKNK
jgi:translation initiation factor 2B subunit (eIF-2B alpha/beta/delta family)